jgi:hypothetical protein
VGRTVGFDDDGVIREEAAGSFLALGGGEYASLPNGGDYQVTVTGFTEGSFTLTVVRRFDESESVVVEYRDVPVVDGTIAKVRMDPEAFDEGRTMEVSTNGGVALVEPAISRSGGDDGAPVGLVAAAAALLVGAAGAVVVLRRRRRDTPAGPA